MNIHYDREKEKIKKELEKYTISQNYQVNVYLKNKQKLKGSYNVTTMTVEKYKI
jgi:DNA-binding GntR family transcriptional regulator